MGDAALDLEHFRLLLLEQQRQLQALEETGDQAAQTVELDQTRVGRLSRMDALQAQAMSQESGRRREQTLRDITAALARIDSGDFGFCRACEEPISPKRLEFDPTAQMCIDCANKAERSP